MDGKIKLLWVGDSPAVSTGFGRVSQGILESLYQTGKYSISVLGINHPIGDPHRYEGMFRIYPAKAAGNVYGFNRVEEVITKEKPDIILINNDLWIASEYVKVIPEKSRIITYSPVDALPVQPDWIHNLDIANARVTTYTNFARDGIQVAHQIPVDIIGHAVDTDEFYPIDDARRFLANIPEDAFVIQNINRNQPRKRLDLFLKAMQLWLNRLPVNDRKNVCFYYHGALKDVGWNLVSLAQRWGIDDRFLVTDQRNMTPAQGVPLSMLCKIFNVADVHVMTSMGEGFGLSPFESAACRVAQVVPNHSACKELWTGKAQLIDVDHWEVLTGGVNTEGGVISVEHLADILDDLYHNRDKVKKFSQLAYDYVQREEFTWKYIADKFDSIITEMLKTDTSLSNKFEQPKTVETPSLPTKDVKTLDEKKEEIVVAGEVQTDDNKLSINQSN
uniref:Putative glycosyltransferase n=1 Tax=viral metagenome TaxID=1070528 RepID=A0A6M3L9C1_9ZZZZ